jgi:general secretion pathway protein M
MITALSPTLRRRALALGILALLLVLVWSLAVSPLIRAVTDRQAEIAALSARLDRLDASLAERPAIERQVRQREQQFAALGGFWEGASTASIAARIQDRLREAVTGSGGRINSMSEASEAVERGFRKLTVRFAIEGTLDTIEQTFAAIETTHPALFVDAFAIAVPVRTQPDGPPPLSFELEVAGYLQGTAR